MGFMVETNDLTRTFKGQKAVDRVSLHVPEGSVYGLLGPNGAGKSTLLKMLCGMLRPTSGEIAFAGRPWTRDDLNDIGALIESPPLYDNLTARENLRVRTTLLGVPENRIDEALATVGLPETGRKRAGQFSMGMKQRLGIALALVGHPRLLILDEPTNGLDPVGIQELRARPLVSGARHHGGAVEPYPERGGAYGRSRGDHRGGPSGLRAPLGEGVDLERLFMDVCLGKAVA